MNYKKLGNTDLEVSTICLGTMTWGEQNTQNEGFEQINYALDQGVNFLDTAEVYAVPQLAVDVELLLPVTFTGATSLSPLLS